MVCLAPNCNATFVGVKLDEHMTECRNLTPLQCEVCEVAFKSPMSKCRHKKKGTCVPPSSPARLWFDTRSAAEPATAAEPVTFVVRQQLPRWIRNHEARYQTLSCTDGRIVTILRKVDGFVNANKLGDSMRRRLKDFIQSRKRKIYLNNLETQIVKYQGDTVPRFGGPHPTLIDAKGSDKGVWIHPLLAFRFARHCGLVFDGDATHALRAFIDSEELKALIGIEDAEVNARTAFGSEVVDEEDALEGDEANTAVNA
jgi:hypothetical protein